MIGAGRVFADFSQSAIMRLHWVQRPVVLFSTWILLLHPTTEHGTLVFRLLTTCLVVPLGPSSMSFQNPQRMQLIPGTIPSVVPHL
jgi:hypothetical protein